MEAETAQGAAAATPGWRPITSAVASHGVSASTSARRAGETASSGRGRRRAPPTSLRVALYSHDTMGLGHSRRNQRIAHSLATGLAAHGLQLDLLLISGAPESAAFARAPGIDLLTLPTLRKDLDGSYAAGALNLPLADLSRLRSRVIWSTLKVFRPHLLIVDNVPRGANGELVRALKKLRKRRSGKRHGCICVLGLRDVLDSPEATRRQWRQRRNEEAIARYYQAIWVYGDPNVFDLVNAYEFGPETAAKIRYLGYFGQPQSPPPSSGVPAAQLPTDDRQLILCQVGGGQDGFELAHAFARTPFPAGHRGLLLTGPLMPPAQRATLKQLATRRNDLVVLDFHPEPTKLLEQASRVIAMGGYNTTYETLAREQPLLVVPRIRPRREQLVRARNLERLGLLSVLHPDALSETQLAAWLGQPTTLPHAHRKLDFVAHQRIVAAVLELLPRIARHPTNAPTAIPEDDHAAA